MKVYRLIILLFFLAGPTIQFAQEHPIISYFKGDVVSDKIVLTWNIIGGNNCNGITIFHSADKINYVEIGSIPGICGAQSESEPYRFTHLDPAENQINYYKLQLGNQGFTTPLALTFYPTNEKAFVFFPNPSNDQLFLFVDAIYQNSEIEIFDSKGSKVLGQAVKAGNLVEISPLSLEAGNYLIRLRDGNTLISSQKMIRID
jgi:hypothetical protein